MATDADAAAATVALFNGLYTNGRCAMAAAVLFIYDAFITLDGDGVVCRNFWTTKRTGALLLYFANKYVNLTYWVMALVALVSFHSDKSCSVYIVVLDMIGILQMLPAAVFCALRAYVLSRSKALGLLIFALSLSPVGADLVAYGYQVSGENFPPFGCLKTDKATAALGFRFGAFDFIAYYNVTDFAQGVVVIVTRVPLIVSEILLVWITWSNLDSGGSLRYILQSKGPTLSDILFRGGNIYFVVLFMLNILNLSYAATALVGTGNNPVQRDVTEFTGPIPAVVISRFLLALQEANQRVVGLDLDDSDSKLTFLSSLGGFIDSEHSARSDDEGLEFQDSEHRADSEKHLQEEEDEGVQGKSPHPEVAGSPTSA